MTRAIYFDMDGTIANLYGVENWLDYLLNEKTKPYREAKPLVDMRALGRELNRLAAVGYKIGVVSWLCKGGQADYNERVAKTKIEWLRKHIGAVEWNEIHIVEYGTPKQKVVDFPDGILFDDEIGNRKNWLGNAFDVDNIIEILKGME